MHRLGDKRVLRGPRASAGPPDASSRVVRPISRLGGEGAGPAGLYRWSSVPRELWGAPATMPTATPAAFTPGSAQGQAKTHKDFEIKVTDSQHRCSTHHTQLKIRHIRFQEYEVFH